MLPLWRIPPSRDPALGSALVLTGRLMRPVALGGLQCRGPGGVRDGYWLTLRCSKLRQRSRLALYHFRLACADLLASQNPFEWSGTYQESSDDLHTASAGRQRL